MATLQENIRQVNSDFQAIKAKIVEKGVEVADGTKTYEYASKVDAVYEAGRRKEYDDFWDTFQDNGKSPQYDNSAFGGSSWYDARFKPKYDIKITGNANSVFINSKIHDFKGCIESAGINFTFENITSAQNIFQYSQVHNLPSFDFTKATSGWSLASSFDGCTYLQSIDKIIVSENTTFRADSTFLNCRELIEIRFEGVLGTSTLDLHWSTKLSKASITNIINALSTTTTGLTVTLSQTAVNNAFTSAEWEVLEATKTNWTISLL